MNTTVRFYLDKTTVSVLAPDDTNVIRATRYTGSDMWHIEPQYDPQGDDITVTPETMRMLASAMEITSLFGDV